MSSPQLERHPDLAELRWQYERAAETRTAQVTDGLTLLAGLYLAISPWVIGFNTATALTVMNLIIGAALMVLAAGFAAAYSRTHGLTWVTPVIGAWVIISPWVIVGLVATPGAVLNNVIVGAVMVVLGLTTMLLPRVNRQENKQ